MLSIKGTYDGRVLKLSQDLEIKEPKEVIITFLEGENEGLNEHILKAAQEGGAFDFLDSEDEDIYSDADLKVNYK